MGWLANTKNNTIPLANFSFQAPNSLGKVGQSQIWESADKRLLDKNLRFDLHIAETFKKARSKLSTFNTLRELILVRTNFGEQPKSWKFVILPRIYFGKWCNFFILAKTNFDEWSEKTSWFCLISIILDKN